MKQKISDAMLIKYLLGEAAAAEVREIEAWITASSVNHRKLGELKIILEASRHLAQESTLNETEAWVRFKELRAESRRGRAKVRAFTDHTAYRWLQSVAALLLIWTGWWMYHSYDSSKPSPAEWVRLDAENSVRIDTLPDGSIVHLNKNSGILYAADFNSRRNVRLKGEAFFEVRHNKDVPFNVQAGDIKIVDIGTAFNVKSLKHKTEVIVESGVVSVSRDKASVKLNALQKVVVRPDDKTFKIESTNDQLYNYYRTNKIIANNTPLWRLVEVINEAYGSHIQIHNHTLWNIPITVSIRLDDPLNNVLNVMQATTPEMKVDRTGDRIMLK
jgi:transmembrane sensor